MPDEVCERCSSAAGEAEIRDGGLEVELGRGEGLRLILGEVVRVMGEDGGFGGISGGPRAGIFGRCGSFLT